MRTRSLILLVLLVTLSGCIVTYRDFPIVDPLPSVYERAAPPRCRQTILLGGLATQPPWNRGLSAAPQEALKNYAGCSSSSPVDDTSKGVETEVVVSVLEKHSDPWYETVLGWGLIVSGGFLPFYGQSSVELFYSFYDRTGGLTKRYQYRIAYNEFVWLLVLPFSWINFFTYSLEDATRSTTAQIVIDAQRDGYLGTAE